MSPGLITALYGLSIVVTWICSTFIYLKRVPKRKRCEVDTVALMLFGAFWPITVPIWIFLFACQWVYDLLASIVDGKEEKSDSKIGNVDGL